LTADQHKTLRHIIHFIDEGPGDGFTSGAYKEILPAGNPFPTSVIWYTSATKTDKIVEKTIGRSPPSGSNAAPNPIIWKMYDNWDEDPYVETIQPRSRIKYVQQGKIVGLQDYPALPLMYWPGFEHEEQRIDALISPRRYGHVYRNGSIDLTQRNTHFTREYKYFVETPTPSNTTLPWGA